VEAELFVAQLSSTAKEDGGDNHGAGARITPDALLMLRELIRICTGERHERRVNYCCDFNSMYHAFH
jgi:uncharacterized spore protein YtfJ